MNCIRRMIRKLFARRQAPNRISSAVGSASGKGSALGNAGVGLRSSSITRHPLDAAFARLTRADELLRELSEKLEKRWQDQVNAFLLLPDPKAPASVILDTRPGVALPVDRKFGILVGEICQNLRIALEYLVHELALLDSGENHRTQFPIATTLAEFSGQTSGRRNSLSGLSSSHVAMIEKLQPYNGGIWLKNLQSFSNKDKHRTLHGISSANVVSVDVKADRAVLQAQDGIIRSARSADGGEKFVRFQVQSTLFFDDGSPVIVPLREIRAETEKALVLFKAEFP